MSLIKEGETTAFNELYNRHWQPLYVSARNVLRCPEVAKDLVQEVFVSIWQNREKLDILVPRAYLKQAVRFQVLKAIRANKVDDSFYRRLGVISQGIVLETPYLFKELQHIFRDLIESLPEDCRTAFRLSREENLSYSEIAQRLNVSVKTVEKRISRSLHYLRIGLGKSAIFLIIFLSSLLL